MRPELLQALVVAKDRPWIERLSGLLVELGFDVHTASDESRSKDLIRKHTYELVFLDQSVGEAEVIELLFYYRDFASPAPPIHVSGNHTHKYTDVFRRLGVYIAGPQESVINSIIAQHRTSG
jgi:DNA-binding response OmpR family regulator